MKFKIGFSKDIHRLVSNRKLILGGVNIPFDLGEDAHSDGDVVYHALAESILGALALGDLGTFYPPENDEFKNVNSSFFVLDVVKKMEERGYSVSNVDICISLEKPKLKDFFPLMKKNVASLLKTHIENVSIKAMSNEKLDSIGLGLAVEATSIILLTKIDK